METRQAMLLEAIMQRIEKGDCFDKLQISVLRVTIGNAIELFDIQETDRYLNSADSFLNSQGSFKNCTKNEQR